MSKKKYTLTDEHRAQLGPWAQKWTDRYRFTHAMFWVACDRPRTLKVDDQNRPHSEIGPSHEWADGVRLYHWHGTKIPREWIERKDAVDPSLALTWENIEQRRALCEILGWEKVISQLSPRTIDKDPDPMVGELLEVDLPDAPRTRFLRVKCPTGRDFVLGAPDEARTAAEAQCIINDIDMSVFRAMEAQT